VKTILVTGGCGFIGSHFLRLLHRLKSWKVVNLDNLTYAGNMENLKDIEDNKNYLFVKGDICDRVLLDKLFKEQRFRSVVNFAAESHVDRSIMDSEPFLRTNVIGVQALLEASRLNGIERFLQISTDEVYGDADGKEPFIEISPLCPSSPYAASKAAADLMCLAYHHTHGVPVIIARSSNNYGPYQFPEKLIPLMIRNGLTGRDLPVYGDGMHQRDWLYVEDNVEAILQILDEGKIGSIYNVGTGEERTNQDVIHLVCRLLAEEAGLQLDELTFAIKSVTDRPGHDRRYALNTKKIREELGWFHRTRFDLGLKKSISWYSKNLDWVKRVTTGEYEKYYDSVYLDAWGKNPRYDKDSCNR